MSNTNMNRRLSLTKNTRGEPGAHSVDVDLVYENAGTLLTLSLGITRDFSSLKSKENLMRELEAEWNGFLKVLKDEGLISDSSSKETTGAPLNTCKDIQIGQYDMVVYTPSGNRYHSIGPSADQNSRGELEIG